MMDTDHGREIVAYATEQPSPSMATASTSGASFPDAAVVVDPLEYLHLAGMIGATGSIPDDLEWVDRESNPGPQFQTGDIDVLKTLKQLDIRVPIPVGHLLTISEAANDKLLQHCQKNQKCFTYQRIQRMLKKKEEGEEVVSPEPDTKEPVAACIASISLAVKDHFVRARPVLWKSAECDCEVCGFKVALEKCQFSLTTISFLGHVVTDKGLQPEPQKVAAVRDAPVPTTITQVRAFMGLTSYYRRFIKGFTMVEGPLTNLMRKDQPLIWTPECDQAFSKLKAALISAPILIRPDLEKPFVLITDWQPKAISAILAQVGPIGLESVVEYASKLVPACKRNYAAPTGECYAALWGISHFRAFLYERKFTLVTDHEPPLALKKSKDYSGMIGRWATVPQSMDFDIRHRKHERHGNADGLTRLHRPEKVPKGEEGWRTNAKGDLIGFLFGSVRPGRRQLIAQELIAQIVQLADDLLPDIYFQSDNSPAPYIFERSLDPYLQWTSCLEEPRDEDTLPSQQEYLKPYEIIPYAFYPRAEEVVIDDDNEEEDNGEETSEEGSYSEHCEGELSEEEEEEEGTGSEWQAPPEEAKRTGTEAKDPEAARKREEIASRKRQLEFASEASLHIGSGPTRDPEPPRPDDGDPAAATSSTARRRRRRSPSSSSPTRPPVRPRTNAGDRPSTSDAAPPTT
ncbi:hypothetical protein CBR_g50323 [Chara braunii]|uniref:Reverse transcriptase/retrotransposon-derived protein RNase H-like domain-containing protein n=1 Tax=Chara braunii TaxID=69332 RepID=A0A388K5F8_CHABU|nr:hypothetical protein CBR_g50323 [Chara braunii]|eukprot:GBG65281.1 hypothetical protein CBR_g50323 [Chara braunii]